MAYTQMYDWEENDDDAAVYLSKNFRIRLTDPDRNLLPSGRCRIVGDEENVFDFDDEGVVQIPLQDYNHTSVTLEWEPEEAKDNDDADRFYWRNTFQTNIKSMDDEGCIQRLNHLGFTGNSLSDQVNAYEAFFNRTATGDLNNIKNELTKWHDCSQGQDSSTEDINELVNRIYKAFNDSGFLGMGGTDEEEVLKVLTIAKEKGLMSKLKELYASEHPDEPGLEEELEDELSGDDLATAQGLVRDGLST